MAVVSPVLSPEWPFSTSINPFDVPSYGLDIVDHASVVNSNKKRARDIEWDRDEDVRLKKAKTATLTMNPVSSCLSVEPQQLQKDYCKPTLVVSQPSPIEHVLSFIDVITNICKSSSSSSSPASASTSNSIPASIPEESQPNVLPPSSPTICSTTSNIAAHTQPTPRRLARPKPTSPLSGSSDRAPFVRKVIGGSCAGKTELELCRWVLTRNHFVNVRCLDPTSQPKEWIQNLKRLGWQHAHPYYQAQAAAEMAQTYGALTAFSGWVEDDFDYDGTEYIDGDWSDEEEGEEGEILEEHDSVYGQRVWDSREPVPFPTKVH